MFALIAFASSASLKVCFYDSSDSVCPSSYEKFKISDFKDFSGKTYNVDSVDVLLTADIPSENIFRFAHFGTTCSSASFTAKEGMFAATLSLDTDNLKKLSLNGIKLTTSKYKAFDDLTVVNSVFVNKFTGSAISLAIDAFSLASFPTVNAENVVLSIGDTFAEENVASELVVPTATFEINDIKVDTTIQMFGHQLRFKIRDSEKYVDLTWKKAANVGKITHNQNGVKLFLESIYYGIDLKPCVFDIQATNGAIVSIPQAIWPNAAYMKDNLVNITATGAKVSIANRVTPISLVLKDSELELASDVMKIMGSVSIDGSLAIIDSEVTNVTFASLIVSSGNTVTFPGTEKIIITNLETDKCKFAGNAVYYIENMPAKVSQLEFDNLEFAEQTNVYYTLNAATSIKVGKTTGKTTLVANFVGDVPTEQQVLDAMGVQFTLVEVASGSISFKLVYPKAAIRGFCSGTHIFTETIEALSVNIKLTDNYNTFYNKFCWDPKATGNCTEGYYVLTTFEDWKSLVRPTIEDIYFDLRELPRGTLDFADYKDNGLNVNIYQRIGVELSQDVIEGQVAQLNVTGGQIVIKHVRSPILAKGNWILKKTKFTAHSIETLRCYNLASAEVDSYVVRSNLFNGCIPQNLAITDIDEYPTVVFNEESIALTESTTATDAQITLNGTMPHFVLMFNEPALTFKPAEGVTEFKPVVEFLNSYPQHTLTIGDFPEDFNGLFGYSINGKMVVEGSRGQVPVDVAGNIDVDIVSDKNVRVIYPWCVNTYLHPDSMATGTELKFDEAYFGTNANIKIKDGVDFHVVNGYYNKHGKIKAPVNKMKLSGNMTVYSQAEFFVDDFEVVSDSALLHVIYRLAELPSIRLDRKNAQSTYAPKVTFAYEDGNSDEIEYLKANADLLGDLEIPVICGVNLGCDNWEMQMTASNDEFSDGTNVIEPVCVTRESQQCVVLHILTKEEASSLAGVIVTAVLMGLVVVVLIVTLTILCIRKKRLVGQLNSQRLLTTGTSKDEQKYLKDELLK